MDKKESWRKVWVDKIFEAGPNKEDIGKVVDKIYEDGFADCEVEHMNREREQKRLFEYVTEKE